VGMLTHRCLLGKTPMYLSNCCIPVAQVATRRHLRSAARHQLTVPRHGLSTFGRQAFAVAGPTMFNALPDELRDPAVSITFGQSMKTHLFSAYQHVLRIRGVSRNALYKCTILTYLQYYREPRYFFTVFTVTQNLWYRATLTQRSIPPGSVNEYQL